ncbi:MAG: VCBS repeat-containing protein [Candidatus Methanofastidiosa archaeon]|nr:VCBS repeat-containing protein [Candidatus Methanofastidiosa archaeon]
MKKIISIILGFLLVFSLGIIMAEDYTNTPFASIDNPTSLYIYDLNKDGKDEVLVSSTNGKLFAFDTSGIEKWSYDAKEAPYSIYVGDIDGDNLADIILGTGKIDPQSFRFSSGKVIVLNHFGRIKWDYGTTSAVKSIYVDDFDKDGKKDILASSDDGILYALENNGTLKWDTFTGSKSPAFAANVLGGADTVIVHGQAVLNSNGKIIRRAPDFFEWKKYILTDLNKDGKTEFLMVSHYPFVTAFNLENADLKAVWQYQCEEDAMDAIVYDLDGDGKIEVIISSAKWLDSSNTYGEGKIYIVNGNDGSLKMSIPSSAPTFYLGVTDINNDGKKDIVYTSDKGVNTFIYGLPKQVEEPKEQLPPKEEPKPIETPPKNTPGFEIGALGAATILVGYYLKRRK